MFVGSVLFVYPALVPERDGWRREDGDVDVWGELGESEREEEGAKDR